MMYYRAEATCVRLARACSPGQELRAIQTLPAPTTLSPVTTEPASMCPTWAEVCTYAPITILYTMFERLSVAVT